ncbi:MAG: glycoside hydrolase family 2 TIM barrel-domain containing protein [Fimbriimonas sp.]
MNLAILASLMLLGPSKVTLTQENSAWKLRVDGKPFVVRGVGGDAPRPTLVAIGGNSVRTWGADNLGAQLDEAQKLGLKVTIGIWLGHKEHGFKWDDPDQVTKQFETAKAAVLRYKDHPALLMWAMGNEMEGYGDGNDPNIWLAVEDLAHMAKKLDPNHPVMTVVAEIGGKKIEAIHKMCPSIDVVGINTYAGASTIHERYTKQGGTKPYILTEFGPPGPWESESTSWQRPIELSSTDKEGWYEKAYRLNVTDHPNLCLGAYAFIWGNKQESTATWFGMFLHDGSRLGPVDVMQKLWTGKSPANACPRIEQMKVTGDTQADPGDSINVSLKATDPEGDPLKVTWTLSADSGTIGLNGDKEDVPDVVEGAISAATPTSAKVTMPKVPGPYRLFAVVRDSKGGAAVANVPLRVRGAIPIALGAKAKLPLSLYTDAGEAMPYTPAGWMGNAGAMKLDPANKTAPHGGKTCIRWDYTANDSWGGIAWQSPDGDWGDKPGGYDLTGAKKLTVWARGTTGGEVVSLGLGLIKNDKKYFDTAIVEPVRCTLTTAWQKFEVPLASKDLRRVKMGLVMTTASTGKPITVYLDDITID